MGVFVPLLVATHAIMASTAVDGEVERVSADEEIPAAEGGPDAPSHHQ